MYSYHRTRRILSILLAIAMILTILPVGAIAADTDTVYGSVETIAVGGNVAQERENNFNKNWKFYLGDNSSASNQNFDDSGWESVDVPHDFSIIQAYTASGEAESGFLPGGTGWYRKSFTMPEEAAGKSVLLNFDGVYMNAYVYVNGTFVGEHHYGYTSFAFDISKHLVFDGATENVVAVKAVNNLPSSRWYSGSGIYRDVTLIVTEPIHVDLHGTRVATPNISSGDGTVNVSVEVVNDGTSSTSVTVTNTVYEKESTTALASANTTVTVNAGVTATASANPVVTTPNLWSVETPNMYVVKTELSVDGNVVDTYETEFGFRWFEFNSSGFHLNGKPVKLNGVCMHHDQGALGSAAYYDAMYRQLSIMKEMGCNAIRTSHNPADEDFIAICSELGLLVIEEAFDGLVDYKNENTNDFSKYFEIAADTGLYGCTSGMTCSEYAARSMVKRDRNQPSVIAWSFGNEIQEGTYWTNVSRYDDICTDFIEWVDDVDGSRPVTSGDNNRGGSADLVNVINTITKAGGIAGFNYANSASTLYSLAQSYGGDKGVIIASETASATNSRGRYMSQSSNSDIDGAYHLTSYDTSSVSWGITAHDSIFNTYQHDCVAGEFVWTGFDYLGEPTPWNGTTSGDSGRGAIPNSSYFGIVETTGFEKDTYYLYRSQWNKNETTVHLVTAWDADNYMLSNSKVPVWLYSNAPKVELYLNGNLIATSTRNAVTSSAGHTYYTYTSESNNTSVCTVSNGSGADALYAVFNVAYTAGTLSTKAYDENDNEIALDDAMGRYTVTTPGTVSKLEVSQNKAEIAADGSSLVYISVDVLDKEGNLDTTASNNIVFELTGNGEILGVDNGDQATTAKYQQRSVLTSSTSANINAYAGKALVIVRSTEDAGSFTVNVSSSGLTGGSASVTTTAVSDNTSDGLVSYTMIKDYSVMEGTVPAMDTASTGTLSDGTTVSGTITWNAVSQDVYGTAGDYTINGVLNFAGYESINVVARLHVIPNVIAMRNVSTATTSGEVPSLPDTVKGILADGTLAGLFSVQWESVSADELTTVGDIVTVNGTAAVFGTRTMPVICTIRVAQAVRTESANVASMADSLTQDIASGKQSDNLESVRNGTLKPGDNTSERWTNWNNRTTSATATLTFTWATAQMLSSVNLYYYYDNCCAYPEAIEFSYSLNGQDYIDIDATAAQVETYSLGAQYSYTFAEPINPVGLKITLTQQSGTSGNNCVGLTEVEIMTYAATMEYNTSADLSVITVDGSALSDFAPDTLRYEAEGETLAATTDVNAGITILPAYDNVVRILTISEDGSEEKTYEITVTQAVSCEHTVTEIRDAVSATCTTDGYTGDIYCTVCGIKTTSGETVTATGHSWSDWSETTAAGCTTEGVKTRTCSGCGGTETEAITATGHGDTEVRDASSASCTVDGYTGDTYCTVCGNKTASGQVIAATGHSWGEWSVTSAASCTAQGEKTRTCTVSGCDGTETETIAATGHSWGDWTVNTPAGCTAEGEKTHTCSGCGAVESKTIAATGHQNTEVRDSVAANCTTEGYTGDTYCSDCDTLLAEGSVTATTDHSWNEGETGPGGTVYTCTGCGAIKTEVLKSAPVVTLKVTKNISTQRLVLSGKFEDYVNVDKYYEVTSHGIVYMQTVRLGKRVLTVNTSGRSRVTFSAYKEDGSFVYNLKPSSKNVSYTVRAFMVYTDPETGKSVTVYSDPIVTTYNKASVN